MATRRRTETGERRNPIQDAIALRAYESYLDRGRADGHALDDWLEAEQALAAAASKPLAAKQEKG
jgi:hypothetical protein